MPERKGVHYCAMGQHIWWCGWSFEECVKPPACPDHDFLPNNEGPVQSEEA